MPRPSSTIWRSEPTGRSQMPMSAGSISQTVLKSVMARLLASWRYSVVSMSEKMRHPLSAAARDSSRTIHLMRPAPESTFLDARQAPALGMNSIGMRFLVLVVALRLLLRGREGDAAVGEGLLGTDDELAAP